MYEFIRVDRHDAVGIITLNRPERFNAWHSPMRHEVIRALDAFNADDAVKAAIITGAGDKAFCAGQDLAETQSFVGPQADEWMNDWAALYGAIRALDKPIIAALSGPRGRIGLSSRPAMRYPHRPLGTRATHQGWAF